VSGGVITLWASRRPVASTGGEKRVVGNIFKSPEILLLRSSSGEELVEDAVDLFLMGKVIETRLTEVISKNVRGGGAALIIEKRLEATPVTRGVGVCNSLGVAGRVEGKAKDASLASNLCLSFGEPGELVYKEAGTEALFGARDLPYTRSVPPNTGGHLLEDDGTDTRLGRLLGPPSHNRTFTRDMQFRSDIGVLFGRDSHRHAASRTHSKKISKLDQG
jgi:hypothetical protein